MTLPLGLSKPHAPVPGITHTPKPNQITGEKNFAFQKMP